MKRNSEASTASDQNKRQAATKYSLHWFRNDLRINDNIGLSEASKKGNVIGIFFVTEQEWKKHDLASIKVDFILSTLHELKKDLERALSIPLIVAKADSEKEIIDILLDVCKEYKISNVFYNKEYEVDESRRDVRVSKSLKENQISVFEFDDQCIVAPGLIKTKEERPYNVFTPFKKTWIAYLYSHGLPSVHVDSNDTLPEIAERFIKDIPSFDELKLFKDISDPEYWKRNREHWQPGETVARTKLDNFVENHVFKYKERRDFPGIENGTSALSPYYAIGALSARESLQKCRKVNGGKLDSGNEGAVTWISELCWRDFYRHILFHYPHVCKNKPFKLITMNIKWNASEEEFERWCQGKTAMFLTKDLLIHWMKGEKFFMNHLIDGDFASNNGGWQWSSSTGTDSQPYFRVFNPYLQSKKFDASGDFIRKWVPELRSLSNEEIHEPSAKSCEKTNYPRPIVDHKFGRERAIAAFKELMAKGNDS